MPSIVATYVYTMVALAIVSSLLVATFNSYITTLKVTSEEQQLSNIMCLVAMKGNELINISENTNSSARVFIQLPATIGYQQYWLRLRNDSSNTWLEGSLGQMVEETPQNRIFLPRGASAFGFYIGGYGPAILDSHFNGSTPQLDLSYQGGQ
jgi:hypothetical protein